MKSLFIMKLEVMFCVGLVAFSSFCLRGQERGGIIAPENSGFDKSLIPELRFYNTSDLREFDAHNKVGVNLFPDIETHDIKFEDRRLHTFDDNRFIFNRNPYSLDYNSAGVLTGWGSGYISASGGRSTLPGLFSRQSAEVSFVQNFGKVTFHASLMADKYQLFRGLQSNFGIGGTFTYQVQDNLSLSVFGTYYKNSLYFSPATMPYIGQSNYGAYASMQFGEHFGMDAGMKREFSPYGNRWLTVPIVTPYIKLNGGAKIGVDVGWLVGRIFDEVFNDGNYYNPKYSNPTVAPPTPPMPPVR